MVAVSQREMGNLEEHATFEMFESKFKLTRCIRHVSVEALMLWRDVAKHMFFGPWSKVGNEKLGIHVDEYHGKKSSNLQHCLGRPLLGDAATRKSTCSRW